MNLIVDFGWCSQQPDDGFQKFSDSTVSPPWLTITAEWSEFIQIFIFGYDYVNQI